MSDKIDQRVDGSGNAFSGSGPVTVNNITKNYYPPEKPSSTTNPLSELGMLFGVPNLPPRYLERDDYLDQFRKALLSEETQAVGITGRPQYIGVQGMGGLGKSVLAAALAWDEQVRRAFPDGIFWLRFGQEVDEAGLLELQKEILSVLAPDSQPESPAQGRNLLNLALQGKRCLIVADDLWGSSHLNHFDLADSGSRFLLTTRDAEVIEGAGAHLCELHLLTNEQARELLAKCSGFAEKDLPDEAEAILRECGRLPLAVAAIGSMVNGKGRSRWQLALDKLQNARLDKIPAKFDRYSGYENLFKVFQVSVEDLPPEVQDYYKTLLVFPEDAEIPESVLQLYWEHIGQGEYEPLEAVDLLVQRSLLTPAGEESLTLHDLLRDYLIFQAHGEVAELHRQLLAAYQAAYPDGWHTIPYEGYPYLDKAAKYFHTNWPFHAQASHDKNLSAIIGDAIICHHHSICLTYFQDCFQFVSYSLASNAHDLLRKHHDPFVIIELFKSLDDDVKEQELCFLKERHGLGILFNLERFIGDKAKKYARRWLVESKDDDIISFCLRVLGDEATTEARILLKENQNASVVKNCLSILKEEAKEEAQRLLKESDNPKILISCLSMLGDEAREEACMILRRSKQPFVIIACLDILQNDAKEEAKRLFVETENQNVIDACLGIIGKDFKDYAKSLLEKNDNEKIIRRCLYILRGHATEEAWSFLRKSNDPETIVSCLHILGERAKEDARILLRENQDDRVVTKCLSILGDEAKDTARHLLESSKHPGVIFVCLKILGNEGDVFAKRFIIESNDEMVQHLCLSRLGIRAKEEARYLIKNSKNESLLKICVRILGEEARSTVIHLAKFGKDPITRDECRELFRKWEEKSQRK